MTVDATITWDDATCRRWPAVVIGAGPAGAMAARELARRSIAVLLVDRRYFPRPKVCGACVNQRAISWLERAELGHLLPQLGAIRTRKFRVSCQGRTVELDLPGGAAVSRDAFDAALVQAAVSRGVEFLPGVTASLGEATADTNSRLVHLSAPDGRSATVATQVALVCDGLGHSSLQLATEFSTRVSPQARVGVGARIDANMDEGPLESLASGTILMVVGCQGYAGVVRTEDGSLNVAAALAPGAVKEAGTPESAVATLLSDAGFPSIPGLSAATWRGTLPLTRQLLRPAAWRVFVLGDAAGYVEPFTGEGIAWALAAGTAVAPLVEQGLCRWSPQSERDWLETYRQLIRGGQFICRGFSALLRRPIWCGVAVRIAAVCPAVCRPLVRRLNQPVRQHEVYNR